MLLSFIMLLLLAGLASVLVEVGLPDAPLPTNLETAQAACR